MSPRPSEPAHKLIITGTGRAGTTFLVQLLTRLGFDTGYSAGALERDRDYFEHCCAGPEHHLDDHRAPYVVKNPELCDRLLEILRQGRIVIDHAIIPVRSLEDAARSRIRVGGTGQTPGGLWGTSQPEHQKAVLAEKFHDLVQTITTHEIPHTFLEFPRFVNDADYTRRQLAWLLRNISDADFYAAFKASARPELVHTFAGPELEPAGAPAVAFAAALARRRQHRRAKRLIGAGVLAAVVFAAIVAEHALRRNRAGKHWWGPHLTNSAINSH